MSPFLFDFTLADYATLALYVALPLALWTWACAEVVERTGRWVRRKPAGHAPVSAPTV
jgi:hypothetical protein